MKTIFSFICAAIVFTACTNAGRNGESPTDSTTAANDSMNTGNTDPNNRNTIGYDSAAKTGDTASYERMRQVQTDSLKR
ncbi:MAG: hypothetical protein DI535_25875 [Citrobacter freundii]|nr:MAG: hypothetical protein DI535_25875 [Citrobacter freundii]